MKAVLLLFLMLYAAPSPAQDRTPVEIVRVEPHSHALCALAGSDDPWGSCLLISYKNVSAQPITAIRFEATFISAMKESDPSVYSYDDTRKVKPGKTQTALWGDGVYWHQYGDKMGASVRVTKVMFADGTFWTNGPSAFETAQQKLFAQAIVDGMAGLFPNARVAVTDATVAFYDDDADGRMCTVVRSSRAAFQITGTTKITVSSKKGEWFGGVRGHREQTTSLQDVDYGYFLMTTRSIYFGGTEKGVNFRLPYSRVVRFQPYSDAVGICKNGAKEKIFAPQQVPEVGWFLFNVLQALAARESAAGKSLRASHSTALRATS